MLGHDGCAPAAILVTARAELLAYPTVELRHDSATGAAGLRDDFEVALASGGAAPPPHRARIRATSASAAR